MQLAILVAGFLLLVLAPTAAVANWKWSRSGLAPPPRWRVTYRWHWIPVALLLVAGYRFTYHLTGDGGEPYEALGFPFLAAAFDSSGADYVSPSTPIFLTVDALIWALSLDLALWLWGFWERRQSPLHVPN